MRVITFNRDLMRPVSLTVNETNITLAASTRLIIEEIFPTLSGKVNQDLLEEVRVRHGVLSEGLKQKLVRKEVARLFPRDQAFGIMEWYWKLNMCMEEMVVIRSIDVSLRRLGLLKHYVLTTHARPEVVPDRVESEYG